MASRFIVSFMAIALAALLASTNTSTNAQAIVGGPCCDTRYILVTDLGIPVSTCRHCFGGTKYPDAPVVNANAPATTWVVCTRDGKKMLRALNAKGYLARCATCFTKVTSQSDAGFLIDNYDNPRALWTIESVADNVVALKAETGKYLARCRGCLDGYGDTDTLSVQETSSAASNAQFRLVPV